MRPDEFAKGDTDRLGIGASRRAVNHLCLNYPRIGFRDTPRRHSSATCPSSGGSVAWRTVFFLPLQERCYYLYICLVIAQKSGPCLDTSAWLTTRKPCFS